MFSQPFVVAEVDTPVGAIAKVSARWSRADRLGAIGVRWGYRRMSYTVEPGVYATGDPGPSSPVFVTANYKLTFDVLRRDAAGIDAWVLVLDTAGVNVWCAAGKGTFGTGELCRQITQSKLSELVHHRKVIVPQLGAPGVCAIEVKKETGFKVVWGPIKAADLHEFLDSGHKTNKEMRRKSFLMRERAALIPVEIVGVAKPLALVLPALFVALGLLGTSGSFVQDLRTHGLTGVFVVLSGVFTGAVATPLFLPWLPGRAFSLKGVWAGVLILTPSLVLWVGLPKSPEEFLYVVSWLLIGTAISAFLAMNFTGCSTYTSLSGVRREMRFAVPFQIASLGIGVALLLVWRLA